MPRDPNPVDLDAAPLRCPQCDNDDKGLMAVCRRVWAVVAGGAPLTGAHGQSIDPWVDVLPGDTIECQARVDDPDEPVCLYRGTVEDFALHGGGVAIEPRADAELHGEPRPQPPAADVAAGEAREPEGPSGA